ncbi:MAG: hypothetical protein RLZZ444_3517, partial [Pseudomonadota bacterium]
MLDWTRPDSHQAYLTARYETLTLLEGVVKTPYVDSVGVPTIGIGFNLRYNLEPVLRAMIGNENWSDKLYARLDAVIDKSYAPYVNSTLITALNAVMRSWHDNRNANVPQTFAFQSDAQVNKVLNSMAPTYDSIIDNWLSGIPESSEREALFSLTWNAPSMLGPKLKAASETGNRAEAWYEIRYNSLSSSLPDSVKGAIANRRYVEADVFSLYDADNRPSYSEAVEIGRMIAAHHDRIAWYEASYDPVRAGEIKGVDISDLADEINAAARVVLKKFQLPANRAVEDMLVAGNGITDLEGDETGYDNTGNDADLLIGDANVNRLSGGTGKDTLIGSGAADILNGGAGADLFVFSRPADSSVAKPDRIEDFGNGGDR